MFSVSTKVKYRLVGDGLNNETRLAIKEVFKELHNNVRWVLNTHPKTPCISLNGIVNLILLGY